MALSGWSASDYIEHGSASALDNMTVGSFAFWLYHTSDASRQAFAIKGATGNLLFEFQNSGAQFQMLCNRATSPVEVLAPTANFAAYALNTWIFVVFTWDFNSDADCATKVGNASLLATVPSAYNGTPTAGSGAKTSDDSGDNFRVGVHTSGIRPVVGRIAGVCLASTVLTPAEIALLQFLGRPPASTLFYSQYGYNGATGVQADWSGHTSHGTVTGTSLTVEPHAPLGPLFGAAVMLPYMTPTPAQTMGYLDANRLRPRIFAPGHAR